MARMDRTTRSDRTTQGRIDHAETAETSHEATSNRLIQNIKDTHTSSIIPVWVSAESELNQEILVYALLDTQSDTTFIMDETANVNQFS